MIQDPGPDVRRYHTTSFERLRERFEWSLPDQFNIGRAVSDAHLKSDSDRVAIYYESETASNPKWRFRDLAEKSNGLARLLSETGVQRGDRVGICLPARPETALAMIASYKLGCVALSMSPLFGPDAVRYRLKHSGAKVLIVEDDRRDLRTLTREVESVKTTLVIDGEDMGSNERSFDDVCRSATAPGPVRTGIREGAHLFYTSGTTGDPKGALHAHGFLLGHIPCFQLYFEVAPRRRDVSWTPADWGWIGAVGDVLLPSLFFGIPVVASKRVGRFDPRASLELMREYGVTCAFLPPTALRLIRKTIDHPKRDYALKLRAVCSAGESVGADLVQWGRRELGAPINEFYGCTEANLVVVSSSALKTLRPGAMGKQCPGHSVEVVQDGRVLPVGEIGEIAVRVPDPVVFLGYWGDIEATRRRFSGEWFLTGDLGWKDAEGFVFFKGRMDDVIKTAGYRVGPEEVEQSINKHASVLESAVVGKADPLKGFIVKAFVVLKEGADPSKRLQAEIQEMVKRRLAAYAYPREVEFVPELPKTVTGKIKRFELRAGMAARGRGGQT